METNITTSAHLYIGTISVSLSDLKFSDFVKLGVTANYMPLFQQKLVRLQENLERIAPLPLQLYYNFAEAGSEVTQVTLQDFSVTSLTFIEGSVYAKIQVACLAVFAFTAFLADYKDAKLGFSELRNDLEKMVAEVFDDLNKTIPDEGGNEEEISKSGYYFIKPERFELNLRKEAERKRAASH